VRRIIALPEDGLAPLEEAHLQAAEDFVLLRFGGAPKHGNLRQNRSDRILVFQRMEVVHERGGRIYERFTSPLHTLKQLAGSVNDCVPVGSRRTGQPADHSRRKQQARHRLERTHIQMMRAAVHPGVRDVR
jgi:hypothetical protein